MVTSLAGGVTAAKQEEVVLGGGSLLTEVEAPGEFVGRTIGALDVRNRFGVQILLIRRPAGGDEQVELVPGPELDVRHGDRLVVMGPREEIERLRLL